MNEPIETSSTPEYILLADAEGAIEAGPTQQKRLDEVTGRLATGEFHTVVESTHLCKCIDGRRGGYGVHPNTAGGTESLMVADDLTSKRFAAEDGTTLSAYVNTIQYIENRGIRVGGHGDDHAQGEASGCGANDKLDKIYEFMARSGETLRSLAEALGVGVDDATHEAIVANAAGRTEFSVGVELYGALNGDKDRHVEVLQGSHNEVIAVVNMRKGTSLDRKVLAREFGDSYQAFNVDAWAFKEAATEISNSPEEISENVIAMVYYNLATAHVLCGKNMRVIVLA